MSVQPDTKTRQQIIFKILEFIAFKRRLCGFSSFHNIFAHLLASWKKTTHDEAFVFKFYEVSVLKKHHFLYCGKLLGVKLKMYEEKGFNILLIPPSSRLELFSLRVVEMVS